MGNSFRVEVCQSREELQHRLPDRGNRTNQGAATDALLDQDTGECLRHASRTQQDRISQND